MALQTNYAMKGLPDPARFAGSANGDVVDYIKETSFFLQEEVNELMQEIGGGRHVLKPWAAGYAPSRDKSYESTDKVKSEAIDMLCFAMNICLAAGITPNNLEDEYEKVYQKNLARQEDRSY